MARRYNHTNRLFRDASYLVALFVLYLVGLWRSDRNNFWLWVVCGAMAVAVIGIVYIVYYDYKSKKKNKLLDSVKQVGAEEDIHNFINSFGLIKKAEKNVWRQGEYSFTWDQLKILRKSLYEKGVPVSLDNYKDINSILQNYIQHKEESFVRDSIAIRPNTFSSLTGADFEDLLCRLYEAMGHTVMKTGQTGDQGCDLVVNMDQQRVVVQAKCYNGSVGNEAVQQAVTALKIYNCTKAIVVTNSYFTPEAITSAKINGVDLIPGQRLRELLLQYLKENWS